MFPASPPSWFAKENQNQNQTKTKPNQKKNKHKTKPRKTDYKWTVSLSKKAGIPNFGLSTTW